MKRIAIFRLSKMKEVNLEEFGYKLLKYPYSDHSGQGFLIDQISSDQLRGRFYYRVRVELNTVDPNGNAISQEAIKFYQYIFEINKPNSSMVLIDHPRSLKIFFGKLCQALGSGFTVEPIQIQPKNAFAALNDRISFHKLYVKNLSWIKAAQLSGEITAKPSLLEEIIMEMKSAEIVGIEGVVKDPTHGKANKCRITAGGTITFSLDYIGDFVSEIELLLSDQ